MTRSTPRRSASRVVVVERGSECSESELWLMMFHIVYVQRVRKITLLVCVCVKER